MADYRKRRQDGIARRQYGATAYSQRNPEKVPMPEDTTINPLQLIKEKVGSEMNTTALLQPFEGLRVPRLHWYAWQGDIEKLSQSILEGDDISTTITLTNKSQKDIYGVTPLILAAQRGHLDICQLLVQHGADLDVTIRAHGYRDSCDAATLALVNNHYRVWWYLLRRQGRKNWNRLRRKSRRAEGMMGAYMSGAEQVAAARQVHEPLMDDDSREPAAVRDDLYRPKPLPLVRPEEQFREKFRSSTLQSSSSSRTLAAVAAAAAAAAGAAAGRLGQSTAASNRPGQSAAAEQAAEHAEQLLTVEEADQRDPMDVWSAGFSLRAYYGEHATSLRREMHETLQVPNDIEAAPEAGPDGASLLVSSPRDADGNFREPGSPGRSALSPARIGSLLQRMGSAAIGLPSLTMTRAASAAAAAPAGMLGAAAAVQRAASAAFGGNRGEPLDDGLEAPLMVDEEDMASPQLLELLPSPPSAEAVLPWERRSADDAEAHGLPLLAK